MWTEDADSNLGHSLELLWKDIRRNLGGCQGPERYEENLDIDVSQKPRVVFPGEEVVKSTKCYQNIKNKEECHIFQV